MDGLTCVVALGIVASFTALVLFWCAWAIPGCEGCGDE